MKKSLLFAALALTLLAGLAMPATAFASSKAATAFRGVKDGYVIARAATQTTITGRLVYRRVVVKNHRRTLVDTALRGTVSLYMWDETTGELNRVGITTSSKTGWFTLVAASKGDYLLRFKGSASTLASSFEFNVDKDAIDLNDLQASAVLRGDGKAFVTASVVVSAPPDAASADWPAEITFVVAGPGSTIDTSGPGVGGGGSGLFGMYHGDIFDVGRCELGFDLPGSSINDTLTMQADLFAWGGYYTDARSAITTFTISSVLVH